MSIRSGIRDQVAALVHPGVGDSPCDRERHEAFIAGRLVSSLPTLALLPIYLTYHGLHSSWETIALAWLLVPLVAVLHVSRSGRIVEGHALCLVGISGFAGTLTIAGAGSGAALAWLILMPLEALAADRAPLILAASLAALLSLLGFCGLSEGLAVTSGASPLTQTAVVAPAILYAAALALGIHYRLVMDRRRAEADASKMRLAADAAGDLVLRLDGNGSVRFASAEAQALFDLSAAELMGRGLFERIHVGDRPAFLTAVADAADAVDSVRATVKLRRGQTPGKPTDVAFATVDFRIRAGIHPVNGGRTITAVVRDITDLHQAEAAQAGNDSRLIWKDRFLANVSHELRTPLNAIIGFSEMLGTEHLVPANPLKQREYANIIRSSGEHLLSVVNTILDMSKIESGGFDIHPEPFEIAPLIHACCDMIGLKAEQGSVTLIRDIAKNPIELVADKRACKQILINLLSNAIKFTPAGGAVTVAARAEDKALVLTVRDTGIGIMARDLPHIGDPFFQVSGSYDRRYEGTGLGLSVVRGLVGLHGGSIAIESAPGEGTIVSVNVPLDCRRLLDTSRLVERIDTFQRQVLVKPSVSASSPSLVKKSA